MPITLVPYVQEKTVSNTPDIRFVSSNYSQGYTATAFEPAYNFRSGGSGYALYIDDNNYIKITCQTSGYVNPSCEIKYNGSVIGGSSGGGYSYGSSLFCGLAIDEDAQEGYCTYIVIGYGSYTQYCNSILVAVNNPDNRHALYNLIKMAIPPEYNWQSVPSISGKNGILLLSTIQSVYLNNGDPVNDALESYIDFIDDSKVAVLVEQEIDDLTKVTVKYVVPAGTYEYIKLVYKTGSAPTSITDGTAVDILQAAKKVILSGIADGSTYFFKIFTDITESEPYEFTTVRPVGDNFFTIDFSSDGRDTMRYNASKTIHVQADVTYSVHSIDYYAAQGALADPASPSNPTYTISNGELTTANDTHVLAWAYDVTANQRIIPANCTLWFEFDAYFLNSEGYLDWRMYNDQGVEKIYWCWDTKYAFSANQWYNCKLEATIVNGIIPYAKYYVDNNMVVQSTENDHMLCIDEDNPVPLYFITFTTTRPTKLKNMKIYWE